MKKYGLIFLLALGFLFVTANAHARTPNIIGNLETINNNIIVNISMTDVSELEKAIRQGTEKEITFTIELIRVWKFWPDEFVTAKKIKKTIKYDNLRGRYWVSSFDGVNREEKQFKDFRSLKNWMFTVHSVNLANVRELEPAKYYIRVIVESKNLEQLPVMGLLIHLVPEVEMSLAKESQHFFIGEGK